MNKNEFILIFDQLSRRNTDFFPSINSSKACVCKILTRRRSMDRSARRLFQNDHDRNGPLTRCALKKNYPAILEPGKSCRPLSNLK